MRAPGTDDGASRIDSRLAAARARIERLEPAAAESRHASGHLLVDIRPRDQRRREGEIPGSVVIERNVLEWRLDPTSEARIIELAATTPVIVFCQQGYTSSLAAADVLDLGREAADLAGGFEAWRAAGLPTVAGGRPADYA